MTRRGFLRAGGGLAMLSLAALGDGRSGKTAGWRPRLALSSVMFSQLTIEAFCRHSISRELMSGARSAIAATWLKRAN
jgi:hypothetical protein